MKKCKYCGEKNKEKLFKQNTKKFGLMIYNCCKKCWFGNDNFKCNNCFKCFVGKKTFENHSCIRKCKDCSIEIEKIGLQTICKKCSHRNRSINIKIAMNRPEIKQKLSIATKKAMNCPKLRKKISKRLKIIMNRPEIKQKLSIATKKAMNCPKLRKKISENRKITHNRFETKQKIRLGIQKHILKYKTCKYGKNEKPLLDKQEILDNCKIERQYPLLSGHFADGYCKETNTIYEVYERFHLNEKRKEKDKIRENLIKKMMPKVRFVIIKDYEEY